MLQAYEGGLGSTACQWGAAVPMGAVAGVKVGAGVRRGLTRALDGGCTDTSRGQQAHSHGS